MYIETKRMAIRDFVPEDARDLHEILGDDETMKNCEPAYDYEKTKAFLTSFCIDQKGTVAAVRKESGKLIGYILFNQLDKGIYDMGWFFNSSFWQQGYAYESCRAVINHAFSEQKARKIFAETIDGIKSVPLMQKLGMRLENEQQKQNRDSSGNWADLFLYVLDYDEWMES